MYEWMYSVCVSCFRCVPVSVHGPGEPGPTAPGQKPATEAHRCHHRGRGGDLQLRIAGTWQTQKQQDNIFCLNLNALSLDEPFLPQDTRYFCYIETKTFT